AAAHEQSTTFDVDRADRIAEQHDREDEPRRCRPDRIFDDAADVIDRARQVAEHHRGSAPVGDERERDAPHDDHAGGLGPAGWRGALRCSAHENSGNVKRKKGADMGVPFQYATVHRGTPTRLAGGLELESALTLRPAPRKSPALLGDGASNGSPVPTLCSAGLGYTRVIIAVFLNWISNDGVRGPVIRLSPSAAARDWAGRPGSARAPSRGRCPRRTEGSRCSRSSGFRRTSRSGSPAADRFSRAPAQALRWNG